jgi:hypothetical protein
VAAFQRSTDDLQDERAARLRKPWRLALFFLLALAATAAAWKIWSPEPAGDWRRRNRSLRSPTSTNTDSPARRLSPAFETPAATFRECAVASGVRFRHVNGAEGRLWMPEMMGAGCAIVDLDDDGLQDIVLVNGCPFAESGSFGSADVSATGSSGDVPATPALFRNMGGGNFEDITANSGVNAVQYGMGIAIGDYDGDGRIDLFFANLGPNRLFQNLGSGRFRDVTAVAGVAGRKEDWSTSCAFLDFDRDGDLDLFVANYGEWSSALEARIPFEQRGRAGRDGKKNYLPPVALPPVDCRLYANRGDGTFADVSSDAGIEVRSSTSGRPLSQALGVRPADLNNDGWLDVIVANDLTPQFLFLNQRNGTFREVGSEWGMANDYLGRQIAGMGVDVGQAGRQNSPVVAIANLSKMGTCLFARRGAGDFVDAANELGLREPTLPMTGFGLFFFDYDLDGRLDLFQANGHVYSEEGAAFEGVARRQPCQLFWKGPPGTRPEYVPADATARGPDLDRAQLARGAAYGDLDSDGDLDILVTENGGPAQIFRNEQQLGHHWLRVHLVGLAPNTTAIGAMVRLKTGEQLLTREVMPTRGYLSQSELPVTFGLGTNLTAEWLEIVWPNGDRQRVEWPPIDRETLVRQSPASDRQSPASDR